MIFLSAGRLGPITRFSWEQKMPVNQSEEYLLSLARQTFLNLWSYANPSRAPGKEIADLLGSVDI